MPCDTITTVGVKLAVADLTLLVAALRVLNLNPRRVGEMIYFGASESFYKPAQRLSVRSESTVAKIKQAYSAEVVKSQAKRFGWTLKETSPFNYQVVKR